MQHKQNIYMAITFTTQVDLTQVAWLWSGVVNKCSLPYLRYPDAVTSQFKQQLSHTYWAFPAALVVKNLCQCSRCKKQHFDPWVKKIPWRRRWHPTLVFLPGKSHGQSPCGRTELDVTEQWSAHTPTPATACMDFSFTLVGFPSKPYNRLMCYVLCVCLFAVYLLPTQTDNAQDHTHMLSLSRSQLPL